MQVLAMGKWSKADKGWKMVVAMHKPSDTARKEPIARLERPGSSRRPVLRPDNR